MRIKGFFLSIALVSTALAAPCANAQVVPRSAYEQAQALFEQGQYVESRRIHETIAGRVGYAPSQFQLGWIYHNGLGVKEDCETAARWYTYAAAQKDASAAYNLYAIYSSGCAGLQADRGRAHHWLVRAANLGDPVAMAEWALRTAEADGGDKYAAYAMVQRAAASSDDGYPRSVLGIFTALGYGIPADSMKGRSILLQGWRTPSLLTGHKTRTASWLYLIAYGAGETPKDPQEAFKWAMVLQYLGDPDAENYAAAVREQLPPELVASVQAEARLLASDTVGTALASQEVFFAAMESASSNPSQALTLSRHLASTGDIRADLLEGILAREGVGKAADLDEALVSFKRGCTKTPRGVSCLLFAEVLLERNRKEEALSILRQLSEGTSDTELQWNSALRLQLGEALKTVELHKEAREIARAVLAADKENARAMELLND